MAQTDLDRAEQEFRHALDEALAALGIVGRSAAQRIIDVYAPRFAKLALIQDSEDAKNEYDDLMVNLEGDTDVDAIDAQTAGIAPVMAALKLAARLARTLVFPAAP